MARLVFPAATVFLAALGVTVSQAGAADWGQRADGRHVYDTVGALSQRQIDDLEAEAAAVDRAGAPTIVYLRSKTADPSATRQDARDLMNAWAVESSRGAKDGLVLLLNLTLGDNRHGSAALVAGAHHAGSGRLNDAQLQAVYDRAMKPLLASGDLAAALSAALSAVIDDLSAPESTAAPRIMSLPIPSLPPDVVRRLRIVAAPLAIAVVLSALLFVTRIPRRQLHRRAGPGFDNDELPPTSWYLADTSSGSGDTITGADGGASGDSSSGDGSF